MAIIGAVSTMRENHEAGIDALRRRMPAHRMGERNVGRLAIGQHDLLHEMARSRSYANERT
jgi:hypothetical protein